MRERRCERTRAWAALAPDGELGVLERRLLEAHLAHCVPCRTFAGEVAAIAEELRAAPAEQSSRRVALPAVALRRPGSARLRGVASAAAVAAMALGIGLHAPAVDERPQPSAAPVEAEDAELHLLRQFRREAMLSGAAAFGSPSGAFGNQPA